MKSIGFIITVCSIVLLFFFSRAAFSEEKDSGTKPDKPAVTDKAKGSSDSAAGTIIYNPPLRGKPQNRVGGGTRGSDKENLVLVALVPEHTGLTTKSSPILYWYISRQFGKRIEFTLNSEQDIKPVLVVTLPPVASGGIQSIDLSKYNIRLSQGIEYQWFVALVNDEERRSKDITVSAYIKMIQPSQDLLTAISGAKPDQIPAVYAAHGVWYDALSTLTELIGINQNDKNLKAQRQSLLQQVGFSNISE